MAKTEHKIALAISGGGYRATLYSLGAIWRLNEFGLLSELKTITSVSGGSITSAWLAHTWKNLEFVENGVASNFESVVAQPIETFCSIGIDTRALVTGLLSLTEGVGDKLARAYNRHLFHGSKIASLPDPAPEFVFYGTNYQTGAGIQLSKDYIHDYKIGDYPDPEIDLAKVVAISSAFPPMFSPLCIKTNPDKWVKGEHSSHFDNIELRKRLVLADGGLYDNLGLEKVWKGDGKYSHVLVCDSGAPFSVTPRVRNNWAAQFMRMTNIMTSQQRALRKRALIDCFQDVDAEGRHRKYGGTYFGISTKINNYSVEDPMTSDSAKTGELKNIRTRLNPFSAEEQGQLINWGYALTDAAVRKHVPSLPSPELLVKGSWPKPEYAL